MSAVGAAGPPAAGKALSRSSSSAAGSGSGVAASSVFVTAAYISGVEKRRVPSTHYAYIIRLTFSNGSR